MRTVSRNHQSEVLIHRDNLLPRPAARIINLIVNGKELLRESSTPGGKNREHPKMLTSSREKSCRYPSRVHRTYSASEQAAAAEILAKLSKGDDVRKDKVIAIRENISAGTYESASKLEIAVDRLLDELCRG